jgi:hypothetical protein
MLSGEIEIENVRVLLEDMRKTAREHGQPVSHILEAVATPDGVIHLQASKPEKPVYRELEELLELEEEPEL